MGSSGDGLPGSALNSKWRALTARCQSMGTGGGRRPREDVPVQRAAFRRHVFRFALWPIALALFGVLAAACSDDPPVTTSTPEEGPGHQGRGRWANIASALTTHLYALESESVRLERFAGSGGAIENMGEDLLVVTPKGRFALVFRDGTVEYLNGNVPMNETALETYADYDSPEFEPWQFRVADILLKQLGEGRYELFATHHYFTGECIRFRLSSTTILRDEESVTVLPDWRTIFDAEPCLPLIDVASGGKMLTDGGDHLLVTIGSHVSDRWRARPTFEPDVHLGKLLRIAIETGEAETLAVGFRNSQGLARDADGNLWATDHGPQGGDELNLLERGGNYGWPLVSYGVEYGGVVPENIEDEEVGKHDGFLHPAFAWVPSPALSAIAVNDERHFPLWKDDLLIASLKDQSLFRVRRHGTDVQYFERIEVGYRIRDLTFMPDGRIALLSDGAQVTFLSRSPRYCDEESRNRRDIYSVDCESAPALPWLDLPGAEDSGIDTEAGAQLFGVQCSTCHDLKAERHGAGPHLVGVIGRPAGEVEGYRFSSAFDSLNVVWTRDGIARFLTDPEQLAPGTSMPPSGIGEAEARAIADYLDSLNHLSRLIRDSQPAIRSDWDVYLSENTLVYVKEPCAPADTEAMFFLALYPVDVNDLPDDSKQYGFDNLDFDFYWFGGVFDGRCMATVALPEYDTTRISTGQYVGVEGGTKHLWEGEFLNPALRNELIAKAKSDYEAVVSGEPVIRSDWDVYLSEDTLVYVKEPCAPADTEAWFFLALYPVDVNDLPDDSKQYGFDNLDFDFDQRGAILDGRCTATVALPEYDIARVSTGQYVPVEGGYNHPWEGEIQLGE